MRWLIAGGQGMLGSDLQAALVGHDIYAPSHVELDITDPKAIAAAIGGADVVVNAAGFTNVDEAEFDEPGAFAVNGKGAGFLAAAARRNGAVMVQVSTDYVFEGKESAPYSEDHELGPLGAYGRSKAEGERLVTQECPSSYIVRTAWLYGAHGPNFAKTMLRAAEFGETVKVVTDQQGQPTWTVDLASTIVQIVLARAPFGIYHATNAGAASWFDFARAVFEEAGLDPARVLPTDSASFLRPAPRPSYSVLDHEGLRRASLPPMRHWREALSAAAVAGVLRLS